MPDPEGEARLEKLVALLRKVYRLATETRQALVELVPVPMVQPSAAESPGAPQAPVGATGIGRFGTRSKHAVEVAAPSQDTPAKAGGITPRARRRR